MNTFIICNTREEANMHTSCYGNTYFSVTREDIEALLAGKILAGDVAGEYGVFISMDEENEHLYF